MKQERVYFKTHLPNLLHEVMNNPGTWSLRMPFTITMAILAEMAEIAQKEGNETMIAYCGRLGLYEASEAGKEGHKELLKIMDKHFK